jgi:hypothetical protein
MLEVRASLWYTYHSGGPVRIQGAEGDAHLCWEAAAASVTQSPWPCSWLVSRVTICPHIFFKDLFFLFAWTPFLDSMLLISGLLIYTESELW